MRFHTIPVLRIYLDSTDSSVSIAEQFPHSSHPKRLASQMGAPLR